MADLDDLKTPTKAGKGDPDKRFHNCDHCGRTGYYPGKTHPRPPGGWRQGDNFTVRLAGRSASMGWICSGCHEKRAEPNWYNDTAKDFYQRHKDDEWGAFIRASHDLKSANKEDVREFLSILKKKIKTVLASNKLPYDKDEREGDMSRDASIRLAGDETTEQDAIMLQISLAEQHQ